MGLPKDIITSDTVDVYGFDGNKSKLVGHISLDVTVITKSLTIDFLLIDYKSPLNIFMGRECMILMESIASS